MRLNESTAFIKCEKSKLVKTIIHDFGAWLLILPCLLILYFLVIRPLFTGVWYSFHKLQGFTVQQFIGLENYKTVFADTQFLKILGNTLKYVGWSLIFGYLPPLVVAIMLNEMVHGKSYFKFSIYFPCIVPGIATSLLWYYMYLPDASGLLNTLLAKLGSSGFVWLQDENWTIPLIIISSTWRGFGGTMIMYLASLQSVNRELYEAAMIDGAGFLRRIFSITLPQIMGIMLLFGVRQIIGVFQIMVEPLAMTGGGPNGASMSIALWSYNNAFIYFNTGSSLAIGVITFIILIILTMFYFLLKNKTEVD